MDKAEARIASQIRREREARNWSLAELATQSDVSKAAISKIERGEVSPSAVVLLKLATAFGLTLSRLLLRAETESDSRLFRAADQPAWRDPVTGYIRKQLFSRSDHPVELVRVDMPAGRQVTMPASSYAHIRQVIWVQAGTLSMTEGGERHLLATGDCLGFGPPSDVTFASHGGKPCAYVVALTRS